MVERDSVPIPRLVTGKIEDIADGHKIIATHDGR